jgi:hypothetical protein
MTSSRDIAVAELQPTFPSSYDPTLRELMDSIAQQTSSQWKYEPTGKYLNSDVPREVTDLAFFEFTPAKRDRPLEFTLPKGWKRQDRGHWIMLSPPDFPVGLDLYELGTYSADDATKTADLLTRIRREQALEWAQRVKEAANEKELVERKVGPYDALYFEALIPTKLGKDFRWRHWVFMVDNRCFMAVSTIDPELEGKILPDVQAILGTLKVKPSQPMAKAD